MLIVDWTQITNTNVIPPMGDELADHLASYNGTVKHTSCSAWGLLYKTLQINNLPTGTVYFNDTGKPCFKDCPIFFSLSHTKGLCAVAVGDRPVGVDIECCRTNYNPHMVDRSLCTAEKRIYDGDFTRIWCRKEALAKMTGEGIMGYPDGIDTTKFQFDETLIEYCGQKYWLVAVEQPATAH